MDAVAFTLEDALRLVAAFACGAVIGIEREYHGKPAGLKTIAIVCLSGALLMLLSEKLGIMAGAGVDLSRLAAGVVTGIGFLGAGAIIQSRHHVEGITTASVIWLMSAVGMAFGAGLYGLALTTYALGWLGLSLDPVYNGIIKLLGLPLPLKDEDLRPGPTGKRRRGRRQDELEDEF